MPTAETGIDDVDIYCWYWYWWNSYITADTGVVLIKYQSTADIGVDEAIC